MRSPSRFMNAVTCSAAGSTSGTSTCVAPTTSRRRSARPAFLPVRAKVTPVTTREANTKARIGSSSVTSHLDLDDLLDPEEPGGLHQDAGHNHHLSHLLFEQQVHMV